MWKVIKSDNDNKDNMKSMCSGVFGPVCSPKVCDIPKMPYYQDLVIGSGEFTSCNACGESDIITFKLHIYRELMDVFGEIELIGSSETYWIYSDRLESYHAPDEDNIIAVFHYTYDHHESRELAVFAKASEKCSPGKLYVYSAPIEDSEIHLGGKLISGCIEIEDSDMEHGAH